MDFIQNVDWSILHFIQNTMKCGFLDFIMPLITKLGSAGAIWILTAIVMLFFPKYRKCGITLFIGLALSMLIGNVILKPLIAKPRPCFLDDTVKMLVNVPKDYSFPSGHTMASFISATIIFASNKKLGLGALALALLISFSRLYLYVHFPSDVLGGIVIGICIGLASIVITEYFSFYKKSKSKDV